MSLDDIRGTDPALVGAKAAALASAKQAGLPVLQGFAIPISESRATIANGAAVLRSKGSGFARAAITAKALPTALRVELEARARDLAEPLVVRSSSRVEGAGVWSGAFASYAELAPEEAHHGVKGCWASVFTTDVLRRAEATGTSLEDIGMGVLVQPQIQPEYGGVASVDSSGTVTIAAIAGPPAAIVSGWERGHVAVVESDAPVPAKAAGSVGAKRLAAVARLCKSTKGLIGLDHIEWAEAEGRLWLLQALAGSPRPFGGADLEPGPPFPADPDLGPLADLLVNFPGQVGHHLVLSWAVGSGPLPDGTDPGTVDTSRMLVRIHELQDQLVAERWPESSEPDESADQLLRMLESDPRSGLATLRSLPRIDAGKAAELIGNLEGLEGTLTQSGRVPGLGWLSHLRKSELAPVVEGTLSYPTRRVGRGSWEALVYRIVTALGSEHRGQRATPGWGAGRIRLVRGEPDAEAMPPRPVVAAAFPLNNLAPLLWDAAGLITFGGSPGAHLFEVASWLGVPAVCGIDVASGSRDVPPRIHGRLGVVQGDAGSLFVLEP